MLATRRSVLVGAIVLALLLIPIPYRACPTWDAWVVDETGRPVPGMTVRLVYQDYSAESRSHEVNRVTDERGHVVFTAQLSSASILRRCYYTGLSATAGAHASFGRHAWVFAFGKGLEGTATTGQIVADWTGSPYHVESRIVAAVRNLAPSGTNH